jgi:ribosome-binding factor A
VEISEIVQRELNDPRLGIISITRVDMSPDLRYAHAHVSVFGSDEERDQALKALRGASGYIRHQLRPRMRVRHIPELTFEPDQSMAYADTITRVLKELHDEPPATEIEQSSEDEPERE